MPGEGNGAGGNRRVGGQTSLAVSYWLHKYGLQAHGVRHTPKGGVSRAELEPLVEEGLTVEGIARRLGIGDTTARNWLKRHGLRTEGARRRATLAADVDRKRFPGGAGKSRGSSSPRPVANVRYVATGATLGRFSFIISIQAASPSGWGFAGSLAPSPNSARRLRNACSSAPTAMPRWRQE